MTQRPMLSLVLGLVMGLAVLSGTPASADIFSKILMSASKKGAGVAKTGALALGALEGAATFVARLPASSKASSLAVHMTQEGHWKFVNHEGQVFTAASTDELARATTTLLPKAADEPLALYLSEDTAFRPLSDLAALPAKSDLHLVVGSDSLKLRRVNNAGQEVLAAEVRPNMTVLLTSREAFTEAAYLLGRPMNRSNARVLALEPDGAKTLSTVPRYDPATKTALVDAVDPAMLPQALSSIKGQTVIVAGRVEGGVLTYKPASAAESTLSLDALSNTARDADVNLVILDAASPRQPGSSNWFWQKTKVTGLDEALTRATYADFLSTVGANGSDLVITATEAASGRFVLKAAPPSGATTSLTGTVSEWTGEITGHAVVRAIEVTARVREQQEEHDNRIIPGIPSAIQYVYIAFAVIGVLCAGVSWPWWSRIWPPETRKDYAGRLGYHAARAVRVVVFCLAFAPLAAVPAALMTFLLEVWKLLTMPARFVRWLRGKVVGNPA